MQRITATILAITIAAITVSFLATNSIVPTTFMLAQGTAPSQTSDLIGYWGHVTYVERDSHGNIIAYAQTDNNRVSQGDDCAVNYLFENNTNANSASVVCPGLGAGVHSTGFNVIGLINGTGALGTINATDTYSNTIIGGAHASSADGLIPIAGLTGPNTNRGEPAPAQTITFSASSHGTAQIVSPTFLFTNQGSNQVIRGSSLLNANSGTPDLFAENGLSPQITVAPGDTLTVTWNVSVS
jgi:hypothetical protein